MKKSELRRLIVKYQEIQIKMKKSENKKLKKNRKKSNIDIIMKQEEI